jgi:hypothetical protein
MKWYHHNVQCKNVIDGKRCQNPTNFREWTFQGTDTLRRKRKGFCRPCWDEFKKTPAYQKMLEEYAKQGRSQTND